ncbi:MAG: FAD-dependent oxidoreductase [Verrucomicrobia bacterium]|nr:FAD-dependent oxidoreductase [Verrucomicrobiota bacterium]
MSALKLTIDGRPVEVAPGTTILQAARQLGITIPTLCHVEGFAPSASCFLCAVKIEGRPNLWPSCAMPAADGMVVVTQSDEVRRARKTALELLVSDHAGDCVGPCSTGCPARLRIPDFLARVAALDQRSAAEIVTDDLALPASLGRVCPRLCEQRCRQCDVTEALSIRNLHRFTADQQRVTLRPYVPSKAPASGRSVGIVGAGPAGLAAAYSLLRKGHAVTLFDAHPQPGGMLRYGIPAFRLPRSVLDAEVRVIRELGAEFRLNARLGRDFSLADLQRDFDAVFLAVGAQGSRGLGCPGEDLALPAVEFLRQLTDGPAPEIGSEVVVVGGGNTAMDVSRCAVRLGARSVRVLYRRTRREMPCLLEEVEAAEEEGVQVEYLVAPTKLERREGRLVLTCVRMELGAPDASGRARPVPVAGSEFTVSASCVIAAIGQSVEFSGDEAPSLAFSKWGIAVDEKTLATNLPGVFAGGDAVTGPDLAVRAVAAGKLAAASIDQYLAGLPVVGAPEAVNVLMGKLDEDELAEMLRDIEDAPRAKMPHLPPEQRRTTFDEVELGFTPDAALRESRRCLGCGCGKAIPCRLRSLATEYGVDPSRFVGQRRHFSRDTSHPEIVFEPGKCILCGVCVEVARQVGEDWGIAFFGRGFDTVVAPPLGRPMAEAFKKSGRRAAELCPTGAITLKGTGCHACRRA